MHGGDDVTDLPTEIRREDLEVEHYHAPGQSVNHGPVGVKLRHIPTGLVADIADRASRLENTALAHDELRRLLVEAGHLAIREEFPIDAAVDAAARVRFARTVVSDPKLTRREAWEMWAEEMRADVRAEVTAAATPIEVWLRRRIAAEIRSAIVDNCPPGDLAGLRRAARIALGDLEGGAGT
jgi:protein subunit release factor B